jgi:hypothetical protein
MFIRGLVGSRKKDTGARLNRDNASIKKPEIQPQGNKNQEDD